MELAAVVRLADLLLTFMLNAGVNVQRFMQMRDANGGSGLTDEQIDELQQSATGAVDQL